MLCLLDPAVPLTVVECRVRKVWKMHQRYEYELAVGLRRLFRDNKHRGSSRSHFGAYAHEMFGIPPKLVWVFSGLGAHFERLPLVRDAIRSGVLTYTKAREFIASIEPSEQEYWIEYATTHTNRQIEKAVVRANAKKEGRKYEEKVKVSVNLTGEECQALRKAREKLMKDLKKPLSMDETIPMLADMVLSGAASAAGEGAGKTQPYASLCLCPTCTTTWVPIPGENLLKNVEDWVQNLREGGPFVNLLGEYLCDCPGWIHRRDECPNRLKEDRGPPAKTRYMPEEERRRMEARDGFRCRTPGCSNPLPLDKGHMETPFRDGVPMDAKAVGQQCSCCNQMIEKGLLTVVGEAPFEKYYDKKGNFLGFGYDPTPWNPMPHVGKPAGPEKPPPDMPESGPERAA